MDTINLDLTRRLFMALERSEWLYERRRHEVGRAPRTAAPHHLRGGRAVGRKGRGGNKRGVKKETKFTREGRAGSSRPVGLGSRSGGLKLAQPALRAAPLCSSARHLRARAAATRSQPPRRHRRCPCAPRSPSKNRAYQNNRAVGQARGNGVIAPTFKRLRTEIN